MRRTDRAMQVVEEGDRLDRILRQHGLAGVARYIGVTSKSTARAVLLDVGRLNRLLNSLSSDLRIRGEQ